MDGMETEFSSNRQRKWDIDACISSRARPLVSGTSFATNITVKPEMTEKMKNVPEVAMWTPTINSHTREQERGKGIIKGIGIPSEFHSIMKLKVNVTIQQQDQFTKLNTLPAVPLTFMGNI